MPARSTAVPSNEMGRRSYPLPRSATASAGKRTQTVERGRRDRGRWRGEHLPGRFHRDARRRGQVPPHSHDLSRAGGARLWCRRLVGFARRQTSDRVLVSAADRAIGPGRPARPCRCCASRPRPRNICSHRPGRRRSRCRRSRGPTLAQASPRDGRRSQPARLPRRRPSSTATTPAPLRILAEYLEPLHRFREQRVQDTVVFFGSARITPDGPLGRYYDDARELAPAADGVVERAAAGDRRFVVCSGGGRGIMEAANRGAADAGGRTIGLNIGLPNEQRPNPYITPELSFEFHYFFMRKLWFAHLARALVVFPGRLRHARRAVRDADADADAQAGGDDPVVLYGSSYWNEVINFEAMVRHGMIAREDLELFRFADDPSSRARLAAGEAAHASPSRPRRPSRSRARRPRPRVRPLIELEFVGARADRHRIEAPAADVAAPRSCSTAACSKAGAASRSSATATSRSTGGRWTRSCSRTRTSTTRARCRCCAGTAIDGPVYATPATRDLCGADAARRGDDPGGRRAPHRQADRTRARPTSSRSSRSTARRTWRGCWRR